MFFFVAVLGFSAQNADYTYTTNNGTITITKYIGSEVDVTIPDAINGLPVTIIGSWAFYATWSPRSITIPDNVTSIETGAFYECSSLTNVTLPGNLLSIGREAFRATKLSTVAIPSSVTNLERQVFLYCDELTAINVDALNPNFSSVEGVLFNKSQNTILEYPGGKTGSYQVPETVSLIGERAFYSCSNLTRVTITNSVTSIGDSAFEACTRLTSVTIPNSVTSVGEWTFHRCTSLTSVTFGTNVTSVRVGAFFGCSNLTSVTITNSVTSIELWAFRDCTSLTNLTIPYSVTNIDIVAFFRCTSLAAIEVDPLNPSYSSADGVLLNKSQSTLTLCPRGKAGSYAIPDSVTRIEDMGFLGCTRLTNISIPDSVTSIGETAFADCTGLTGVTIPNSVTSIRDFTFYSCTGLTNVTLPDTVTSIGGGAFTSCSNLTSMTIPNRVTNIGGSAFCWCTSLTNIKIPDSVTSIGLGAFMECNRLIAIEVDPLNPSYSSVDDVLFDKSVTTLIQYPGGKAGSYAIPDSVITIEAVAFNDCDNLTSVTIPERVITIGDWVFASCSNLTSVTIPNSVTSIGRGAFVDSANLTAVYFEGNAPNLIDQIFGSPQVRVYYLPGTTGWSATYSERPTALWMLPNPVILTTAPAFGIQTNGFGFVISWTENVPVVVEASASLTSPAWSAVSSNALTDGWTYFTDPDRTNYSNRFYRVRPR